MKAWHWLGACLVLLALSLGASVHGGGKKKGDDKKAEQKKGDDKKGEQKKGDDKKGEQKKGEKAAGAGDPLPWKAFDAKTPFYQEMTTSTEQKMKVAGMEVTQKQKQTFYIEWTTEKAEKNEFVVKQKIIGVKMDIEIGGNKISYDSQAKEQQQNPLTDFFKALVGQEFKLTITKDAKEGLKVSKVEGRKEFVDNLAKANPQLKPLLEAILSEEALKQMADPVFAAVPAGEVVPDAGKWEKKSKLPMGPIGTYSTDYTYTYKGTNKEGIATIGVETKLSYTKPEGKDAEGGLPFKIVSATLSSTRGDGEIKFDVKRGIIVSSDMTLVLHGNLDIEIAGQSNQVTLDQTQTSSLRTLDKNPIPTPAK